MYFSAHFFFFLKPRYFIILDLETWNRIKIILFFPINLLFLLEIAFNPE